MRTNLLLGLVVAACAWAQSPIAGIRSWTGKIRMKAEGVGALKSGNISESWSVSSGAEFEVKLDWTDAGAWYLGTITRGHVAVNERHTVATPSNTAVTTYAADTDLHGKSDGSARKFALYVDRQGRYRLGNIDPIVSVKVTRPHDTLTWQSPWLQTLEIDPYIAPPANAARLTGAYELKGRAFFLLSGNEKPEFVWKVEYDLAPAEPSEELEVLVSSGSYDWFRPTAGPGGGRGNDITLRANLQMKGGGEPMVKAKTFEWRFSEMSNIPGYAMNMPRRNQSNAPDMRFEPSAALAVLDSEAQMAKSIGEHLVSSEATVASYDWGGFGAVEVTAVLDDGRRIPGVLKGTESTEILLPRRAHGDTIPTIWREAYGAGARPDSADDEDSPIGDGTKGDGLTLYEEYRGFIENGDHLEGDVDRKDYFVHNKAGAPYVPGIELFARLTRLKVHRDFTDDEADDTRVINQNYRGAPHAVDQHLVEIRADSAPRETASAIGGPGNPVMISHVIMPALSGHEEPYLVAYHAKNLVHELLHTVNVWHHGDVDEKRVKWFQREGEIYEQDVNQRGLPVGDERPIRVLRENGTPARIAIPAAGVAIRLGSDHGPHSGADKCVMRYDVANAYISRSDSSIRYYVAEKSGTTLCDSEVGTGVNDPVRTTPQPRYGDPETIRGRCIRQILVNDAVKATSRLGEAK